MRSTLALSLLLLAAPAGAQPDPARALPLLQEYLRIPSVNPPADSRPAAAFLRRLLTAEGIEVTTFAAAPDKEILWARLPGRVEGEDVMLLHHMDVVPADRARWPVDPFAAEIRDGFLYGRGAVDMKSLGILQVLTFLALKNQPRERGVVLLATPDEETGGEFGAVWLLKHHPELKPRYILDEGGFGTRDLLGADGRLTFGVSVAEKRILWLRLTAAGTAGHGSQPTADNPNDRLLAALARIREIPLRRENRLQEQVGPVADNKFTRAIGGDTVAVTSLQSGVGEPPKINVIPSVAQASLDVRLLPDTEPERFLAQVREAAAGVQVEVEYAGPPCPVSPSDTPLFESLRGALTQAWPGARVIPYLVPFGTDSNTFRAAGITCYGFNPLVLDASLVATMHSDSERLPVAALAPALGCYYAAVRKYCGTPVVKMGSLLESTGAR